MRRREFLQSSNLALLGLSTTSPLELTKLIGADRPSELEKPIHFIFVSVNKWPNNRGLLLLNGEGELHGSQVLAKGGYSFLSTYNPLSFSAINSGTWYAEEIICTRNLPREVALPNKNMLGEMTLKVQMTGIMSPPFATIFRIVFKSSHKINNEERQGVLVYTPEGECFSPTPGFGQVVMRTG